MVFSSLTWYYLLRPLSINVSFGRTFLFSWVGVFVDTLIPTESIGGDLSKAYLMSRETDENAGKVLASVVGHRILSMVTTLSTLSISLFILLFILQYELALPALSLILFVTAGSVISLLFIILLCFKEQLTQKIIDSLLGFFNFLLRGRLNLTELKSKAEKALGNFHESIEILRKYPRGLVQPAFFILASWFFTILSSYFVFASLGYLVSFVLITIVYSISCTLQNIPSGMPGQTGLIEVAMTSLYALLGVPIAIGAVATVLIRVLWVWVRLPLGFISFQWVVVRSARSDSQKGGQDVLIKSVEA
jgi:uncharacterized protein (TIRG00374 family)